LNDAAMAITPQATLEPALPVLRLSSLPPLPRSSVFLWITHDLPKTLYSPNN